MTDENIKLLRRIFTILGVKEISNSMVSRRLIIFNAFEKNKQAFHSPEFVSWFGKILGKGKSFDSSSINATNIFSFINENQDLWLKAFELTENEQSIENETDLESTEKLKQIVQRNKIQIAPPKNTLFLQKLLKKLALSETLSYPSFEKEILYYLENKSNLNDKELLEEAVKAYIQVVYKEDSTTGHRLLFEEFKKNESIYSNLGIKYELPQLESASKNISRAMDAVYFASNFSMGIFELKRLISIINRIGETSFSEEEVIDLFTSFLNGGIDKILLNPPSDRSYLIRIEKTIDYDFKANFDNLFPKIDFTSYELSSLFIKLMNILMRIKIIEWSRNAPIGEELTILDLISEIQNELLETNGKKIEEIVPLTEMFQNSNQNILDLVITYYSRKLSHTYLIKLKKGGIEKELIETFRNLGSPSKDLGLRINDIKRSYETYFLSKSWEKEFYYDFILRIASKGLGSPQKQTVKERVRLFVQEDPKLVRNSIITKNVSTNLIFKKLKKEVPFMKPSFSSPEEAQEYFDSTFLSIKLVFNKAWLKKILRTGFELYIEHPVAKAWTNEMDDLSRELILYAKDLVTLSRPLSEINELLLQSLKEAFLSFANINYSQKEHEILTLLSKLPEVPQITNSESIEKYLDLVYQFSKPIINTILNRNVEEETERKTFFQEMEERIINLENKVLDWFMKGYNYYSEIINESFSFEKTINLKERLLKTVYGGIFYLIEEKMEILHLNQSEKVSKAIFLRDLFLKQSLALQNTFKKLAIELDYQLIIDFLIKQITLWDSVFMLKGILITLEADNRIRRAINLETSSSQMSLVKDSGNDLLIIERPGIRGLLARELVVPWIKKWANSVIDLMTIFFKFNDKNIDRKTISEEELYKLLFLDTGRNDIRNFIVPLIVGNVKDTMGFESCFLPQEFMNYSYDVFSEAVSCDAHLSMYFLTLNILQSLKKNEIKEFTNILDGSLDYITYLSTTIKSCRQLLGENELRLSDVVKKATGLSLSGLKLQTIVFKLGDKEIFSAASYIETPFENSEVTGLTLELTSKDKIPIQNLNPLCKNASEVVAGLIERNSQNILEPDLLFTSIIQQLLDEAKLILLNDSGTIKDILQDKSLIQDSSYSRDISRIALRVISAYKLKLSSFKSNSRTIVLPEEVSYYGEKLEHFGLFVQLIIPFFEPGETLKEQIMNNSQWMNNLGIEKREDIQEEIIYPSFVVLDDNGSYKVVFGTKTSHNTLNIVIAEEDESSKMGLRTIHYLLKTRGSFEEFIEEMGLIPLPELNRSIPLNKITLTKEGHIDINLIKNIQLGAQ